jgi:hypothetical protein
MKAKHHNMSPEEFRTYIASEVESIRVAIEHLRSAAERTGTHAAPETAADAAPGAGARTAAFHSLPEYQKA